MLSIAERLKAIDARKRAAQALVEGARAGLLDGIRTGATLPEPAPRSPGAALREVAGTVGDATVEERDGGRLLVRRVVTARGVPTVRHETLARALPLMTRDLPGDGATPAITRIAFLDVETSSLDRGPGTCVFQAAVGWFEEDAEGLAFHLEQFLIDDFCHEELLIARLMERLGSFDALCHYNGRAFDVPVLRARCVMSRQSPTALGRPQVDLLPWSRRLWRGRLGSASLRDVESGVLGIDRGADIEGAHIPAAFFDFVRGGSAARIALVMRHNEHDVAALGALLPRIAAMLAEPEGPAAKRPEEHAALAAFFEGRREHALAGRLYDRALCHVLPDDRECALLLRRAAVHRRLGEHGRAMELWEGLRRRALVHALPAWIELAKHLEHRARNAAGALRVVDDLLHRIAMEADLEAMLGRPPLSGNLLERHGAGLRHRAARLERRIAAAKVRQSAGTPSRRGRNIASP